MGRLVALIVAIALIAPAPTALPAAAAPDAVQPATSGGPHLDAPTREDGALAVTPLQLPARRQVCTGATIPLAFLVQNISPGLEVPLPVFEAGVTVSDDQGRVREAQTNAGGFLRMQWPADREGQVRLTVKATKPNYVPSAPVSIDIQVAACSWGMSIYFHEEYAVIAEMGFVVGADVRWSGTLRAKPAQGEDAGSDIELAGGSGTYRFYASDQIQAPLHWSIDPPVSGDYEINVRGHSDGQTMKLEISTTPTDYPKYVPLKLTDYSNRGIEVNFKPPAPVSGGNGLFLELNKVNTPTFPVSGGSVSLSSGISCFFYTDKRTGYSLSVLVYPLKDMGAAVPPGAQLGMVP
jgi:hypothetical protein